MNDGKKISISKFINIIRLMTIQFLIKNIDHFLNRIELIFHWHGSMNFSNISDIRFFLMIEMTN